MAGLYVVTVEASPSPGTPDFETCGGAFVNVYTTSQSEADAVSVASAEVRDAGWCVTSIDSVIWVTRDSYSNEDDGLEYFEQAILDGVVLVFQQWPIDVQDGDPVH